MQLCCTVVSFFNNKDLLINHIIKEFYMRINISRRKITDPFVAKVEELSGQNLLTCYQCGKCSAGCPAVSQMDILPNQIIRLAQLGLKNELFKSKAIWVCASCMTCNTRCPKKTFQWALHMQFGPESALQVLFLLAWSISRIQQVCCGFYPSF